MATKKTDENTAKMLYRFVVVGDLHLRRTDPLGIVEEDGLNSRLKDKLEALGSIVQYACTNHATHLELLGDIFDAVNPSEKLKELFWLELKPALDANIEIRIIIGNHDRTGLTYNFSGDKIIVQNNIKIISNDYFVDRLKLPNRKKELVVRHIPYGIKEKVTENLHVSSSSCEPDMLFGHFEIEGAQLAPDNAQIRQGFKVEEVPGRLVWLGHIHKFQEFRPGFAYIGSTVKCDFGEVTNTKVFGKIDIYDDGQMKFQYNEIPQRPMYQYTVSEDDVNNLYISEQIPKELKEKGVLIKFKLVGSAEWVKSIDKARFRKRFKNAMRVVFDEEKIDTDRKTNEAAISQKMEDRVAFYVADKKKGKEYTKVGMELAQAAQEKAEEVEA